MNRGEELNFNIWDIDRHIFEMAEKPKELEEGDLKMVAGGKVNNKFIVGSLASLAILTSTGVGIPNKVNASNTSVTSI